MHFRLDTSTFTGCSLISISTGSTTFCVETIDFDSQLDINPDR